MEEDKMIKLGVIGTGRIGKVHIEGIAQLQNASVKQPPIRL